mgnify:CR=1 FL=1
MSQLIGPGPIVQAGPTSQLFTTPWPHKLGEIARDTDGNEYMFVDFEIATFPGVLVGITDANLAHPLLGTALLPERVGVAMTNATSADAGWVQVYGLHNAVQTGATSDGFVSDSTVEYTLVPQASVGSPSGALGVIASATTIGQNVIYGMWLSLLSTVSNLTSVPANSAVSTSNASGPNSAQPATTSHIGNTYAVFLNFPYVTGVLVPVDASQS